MSMIKVVVIDPYTQTCKDVMMERGLQAIYDTIGHGCDMFEPAYPAALGGEEVYVDEESLWRQKAGFQLRGHHQPLLGRGIVIGSPDDEGNAVSTTWTADEVLANIEHWVFLVPKEELEDK